MLRKGAQFYGIDVSTLQNGAQFYGIDVSTLQNGAQFYGIDVSTPQNELSNYLFINLISSIMNTVIKFYLPQLHNGESVSFHCDTLEQLEQFHPATLGVEVQAKEYRGAVGELQESIDVFSSDKLSAESVRRDRLRDRAYSAFKAFVKLRLNDEDEGEAVTAAAERIISVIRQSAQETGDPLKLGYSKESTALNSLLRNLEPLKDDVRLIGAESKLTRLKETNQAFIDLQFERYFEQSVKHSGDVKSARALADAVWQNIADRINAQILLNGDATLAPYVKTQNAIIEKFKKIVALRKGRAKANRETEKPDGE
jgi:hypothetical protein